MRNVVRNANKTCGRVTLGKFNTARDRIYINGYHGPISDEDWAEQDGRPMTMKKSKCIVNEALDTPFPDIEFEHPDFGEAKTNGNEVRKDILKFVYEIYGRYDKI